MGLSEHLENGQKSSTNCFPPSPNFYLRARVKHLLEHIDHISDKRVRASALQTLKELARELRGWKQAGYSSRPVLGFACLMLVMFGLVFWYSRRAQNVFRYYAPTDKFRILRRYPDGYHYDFRWVHGENGRLIVRPLHLHFCETPDSRAKNLSAGETLTFLGYEDIGSCAFISGPGLGFDFEIGPDGHPTSSPNCHEGPNGYRECVPNLLEAIFPEEK